MPEFSRHTLKNNLRVLISENHSSPFAYVTQLYSIGSKHEYPARTGLAHLFEHLMFSGTKTNPDFDEVLQAAGGENNAFTNADYTQFYDVLPIENIDVALQLEADRMENLLLTEHKLQRERKVIIEEFYETCLSMPYGKVWHQLYEITFQKHPYQWPTIGKNTDQISKINFDDVKSFYKKYYRPGNAVLSIVAPLNKKKILSKVEAYFSDIPKQEIQKPKPPQEPVQTKQRVRHIEENIPYQALYIAFHIPERTHQDYRVADVFTDLMSGGRTSRFYQNLYKSTDIFTHIDSYVTGSIEPGLLIVEAKINDGYSLEQAEDLIWNEIGHLKKGALKESEVQKFLNIAQSNLLFSETQGLNTAINLAFFEECGEADLINTELEAYKGITLEDIVSFTTQYLSRNKSNILYLTKKN